MRSLLLLASAVGCLLVPTTATADALIDGTEYAQALTVTGTLVSRSDAALELRDGQGNVHRFAVNEQTRYVWGETANVKDLAPGAQVRAVYEAVDQVRLATSVWLLAPPARAVP